MKKIIVKNDDKFSGECDQAGYREFLFGLFSDRGQIAGVDVEFGDYGIVTEYPEKVLSELNSTGDWSGYPERPVYEVES